MLFFMSCFPRAGYATMVVGGHCAVATIPLHRNRSMLRNGYHAYCETHFNAACVMGFEHTLKTQEDENSTKSSGSGK